MDYSAHAVAQRDILTGQVKSGGGKRLIQVFADNAPPKIQWRAYMGQGENAEFDLDPEMDKAAREMLESGMLVPTFPVAVPGVKARLLDHFDNVNWGIDASEKAVIYKLSTARGIPDTVIPTDDKKVHKAAIDKVMERLSNGDALVALPIMLSGNRKINPVITDPALSTMLRRQYKYQRENGARLVDDLTQTLIPFSR